MDLLFRVACHGGTDEPLNIHLKRITDSAYTRKTLGGAEIDGELIAPVVQESHDGDCRREIMRHLRECLSESSGKKWARIYGGLALTQALMQHGSPALAIEVAHGHHFDLVQKVSFLEHFDSVARGCTDRRAQNVVRSKAKELLATLIPQLQKASAEELPDNAVLISKDGIYCKDTASECSKETSAMSVATTATGSSSSSGSLDSSASPQSSIPQPVEPPQPSSPLKPQIDDAFADLRQWMESTDQSSVSLGALSPRSTGESSDDSDWEPIGHLPDKTMTGCRSRSPSCDDRSDAFFTPMPTPAGALVITPTRSKFMSL